MANRENRTFNYASAGIKNGISLSFFIVFLITGLSSRAQTYREAKDLATKGQYAEARDLCRKILTKEFDSDVATLMARTYAWDGKYDSTRVLISQVLKENPKHWDALDAASDVDYWDGKYTDALKSCDVVLAENAADEHFMLKKSKILHAMGQPAQAADQLESLLKTYPQNAEARNDLEKVRMDLRKNWIRVDYYLDYFENSSNIDPWHMTSLSYGRKTAIGPVIARVNWAQRYGKQGYQYELDAYPTLGKKNFGYLNFGYSDASFFPTYRYGAELYHKFPKNFEASIGMRALYFKSDEFYTITGSLGKYLGNYWLSLRAYVTPDSTGTYVSGQFQARRYFSDAQNYIGLKLNYGVSPDERNRYSQTTTFLGLQSQSIRLEYNHLFRKVWSAYIAPTYIHQQFPYKGYVNTFALEIGLIRYF
jgi:YaiO family outer membrane protein